MSNRTSTFGVLIGVLALVATACAGDDNPRANETVISGGDVVLETSWTAKSVNGEDVLEEFEPVTVQFDDTGAVMGSSGCNQYGGSYQVTGSEIALTVSPTTRIACLELQGEQESRVREALNGAAQFDITDGELTLINADGAVVASFEADSEK